MSSTEPMAAHSDVFRWVGHTLDGKYRLDAVVGEGGFGIVYRAYHRGFDAAAAIKFLRLPATLNQRERERFEQAFLEEGRLLHRLSKASSAIVQAYDLGVATSPSGAWTPYIALEWLDGQTLADHFADRKATGRPISPGEAFHILEPVAGALGVAHEKQVVHRDIKPENLFLTQVGSRRTTKVLDFGIAKVMTQADLARAYTATGGSMRAFSPMYGTPEQFDPSRGATGPWTDVYALALVFVEAVVGRRPYDGMDVSQLHIQATAEKRPTLAGLGAPSTPAVEAVLRRALAVNPRERYSNAEVFWSELRSAVMAEAPTAVLGATVDVPRVAAAAPASTVPLPRPQRRLAYGMGAFAIVTLAAVSVALIKASADPESGTSSGARKTPSPASDPNEDDDDDQPKKKPTDLAGESSPTSAKKNDGTDASRPILSPKDLGFVDAKGGWGWGNRCYANWQRGFLGYAKAECEKGLAMNPAVPNPKASLLYNLGLIARDSGDTSEARRLFVASLAMREHPEVRAALEALP